MICGIGGDVEASISRFQMIPLVKSDGKRKAPKFYPMILRRGDFLVVMMGLQEDTFLCSLGMEMYPHKIPQPSKMNAAESLRSTVTRALVYECVGHISGT